MDRLQMFLGMPFSTDTNCKIKSPTVRSIAEIGEGMYNFYLSLASFNKDELIKALFNPSFEEMEEIQEYDDYNFLISTPLVSEIERALTFFAGSNVIFLNDMFLIDGLTLVSLDNYKEISRVIQELNGIQEKEKPKFRNKTAEKNYYLMKEMEQKYNVNENLSLKDICSILCNAEGNGINV
ncbi:hypothetical protein, partial [Brevibacillus brevis]|uniref:hypothetical protein n=1 Tax=Brevibacillus brevis TaxID=1393 RepID=UPI001C12AB97